jgi:FlaA1/EpsC-like NDP-sugar epimerase
MGAGDAGAMIVRELRANPHLGMDPVGFLDDDLGKHDVVIHGVPVLGDRHAIPEMAAGYKVKLIIIAMPTASGRDIRDVVDICDAAGVQTKIVPGLYELLDGAVTVSQLRPVQIEDLLRREPVQTDTAAVGELLRGKRVLVTGGGGSIGSELCRQILRCDPARLIILGHGENSVFEIGEELRTAYPHLAPKLVSVIAGTRFPDRIRCVFEEQRPQIVFHAAAHKHVPLMEANPGEAITNNVMGTRIVLDAALATGVERFVMISTDKAVNPTNVMGASKRAAELLVYQAAQRSGRPYVAVRFGNVLGSRGSVVHTFRRQIAAGGPVTVTHPDMRRYFMTIPEAVQLVLQAAVLGCGGEVFVLDMGEPVKIADLARDLIELSGLEVGRDIDIRFTGLRPGEKMFEELFITGESYARTTHHKIFVANNGAANAACCVGLDDAVARMIAAAQCGDRAAITQAIQALIPEFRPVEGV